MRSYLRVASSLCVTLLVLSLTACGEPDQVCFSGDVLRGSDEQTTESVADDPWNAAGDAWKLFGLRLQPIPADQFHSTRYRGGMRIVAVREGSAAEQQGIRVGDTLVGMNVWETLSLNDLAYILKHAEGEQLKFYVLRGGDTLYGYLPRKAGQ